VEPTSFDASRLAGMTASHLASLMNLTFVGDEKVSSNPLFARPPSPAKVDFDERKKAGDSDAEGLEKQLDEEMARSLADDDHNADKKFGAGTQAESCSDGAVTQSGSVPGITAVKSLSNAMLTSANVARDGEDHEPSVHSTNHPPEGLLAGPPQCEGKL